MALDLFAGAQAFVERLGLDGWRCAQLLVEQPDQLLVVPQRPPPLSQSRVAAHQPPVGFLQQLVVGYGLAVGVGRLGVAVLGEEEPPRRSSGSSYARQSSSRRTVAHSLSTESSRKSPP